MPSPNTTAATASYPAPRKVMRQALPHRQILVYVLLIGSILGLSACATPDNKPVSRLNPEANWTSYHKVKIEDVSPIHGPALDALKKFITSSLTEKGYEVIDGEADATFRYRVAINHGDVLREEVIPSATGAYVRTRVEAINDARILANLIDSRTGEVAWKASASRSLSENSSPMSNEEMRARVKGFLESLPISGVKP